MDLQEVFALMERFQASGLAELEVTLGGDSVRLKSAAAVQPVAVPAPAAALPQQPVQPAAPSAPSRPEGTVLRAPLVGTFYVAPSPDSEPFVRVGSHVKQGEPVCLIEAMKMMSEVPAPCDCVIEAVLAEDGAMVAFDAPLFQIREC